MDIKAIVDADSMIYASAVTSKTLDEAKIKLDYKINESLNDLQDLGYEIMSFVICCGSKGNFRKLITKEYKANRKKNDIPELLSPLEEYCKSDWNARWSFGIETDDLVAKIWYDSCKDEELPIIVSIDKDYQQFPATIFNYMTKKIDKIDELGALKNFYTQMIVGDSADNIKVCNGKGKSFANKLFKDLTSKYQIVKAVSGVYKEHYRAKAKLKYIETYNLLKLRTDVLQ